MGVKATGAQFKAFYADDDIWKDDAYHEDTSIVVDGRDLTETDWSPTDDEIPDSALVRISGGVFYSSGDDMIGTGLEAVFRKWLKAQANAVIVCEIVKDRADELKAAIVAAGGKIR